MRAEIFGRGHLGEGQVSSSAGTCTSFTFHYFHLISSHHIHDLTSPNPSSLEIRSLSLRCDPNHMPPGLAFLDSKVSQCRASEIHQQHSGRKELAAHLLLCHAVVIDNHGTRLPAHSEVPVLASFDVIVQEIEQRIWKLQ